jgi:serine/threonine-protein kinase
VLLAVLLLLGVAAGYGGWWLASGRWAHVPSVTNDSEVAAKAALTDAGLTVAGTDQSEFSETVAKDAVVRTDPAAGARARRGQVVTLFLSRGPERFTVPDVHGMTETAARDALATIPVKITETSQNDDSVPKGSVIATQPAGGTPVKREAAVTVVVSNGPPVIQVPGVSGKSQDDGTAVLKQTGFAVAVQQAFSDTVPAGTVLSQQPDPGQSAVKFSTVTIVVSKGPEFVTLPNVGGKSAEAATAALQSAGVKVTVKKVYGGLLDITVGLDVAPSDRNAAGQVRRGATVVIDVA